MLKNIPLSRLIIYVMILGLIPISVVWMNFSSEKNSLNKLQNRIESLKERSIIRQRKQAVNSAVMAHYSDADRYYFDKHLESLRFLAPEIESLQVLVKNKNFAGDETVKQRLDFLTGDGNTLLFSEGNVQAYPLYQETIASLVHPVEVNLFDLKTILSLVEGTPTTEEEAPLERPQMIFLDFKLDKKEAYDQNDVFILNMKVLKREFSS